MRVHSYLRTFSFSFVSRRWMRSAQAELWVHSVSASPIILIDTLLSSLLDPLEGLGMLNCGKLELGVVLDF